jgi:hypothetical protein
VRARRAAAQRRRRASAPWRLWEWYFVSHVDAPPASAIEAVTARHTRAASRHFLASSWPRLPTEPRQHHVTRPGRPARQGQPLRQPTCSVEALDAPLRSTEHLREIRLEEHERETGRGNAWFRHTGASLRRTATDKNWRSRDSLIPPGVGGSTWPARRAVGRALRTRAADRLSRPGWPSRD